MGAAERRIGEVARARDPSSPDALAPSDAARSLRYAAEVGRALLLALVACSAAPTRPLAFRAEPLGVGGWPPRFEPLCAELRCAVYRHFVGAAATGDVDGDGVADLVVPRFGLSPVLLLGRGGSFEDASEAWGLDEPIHASGVALADVDGDGDLDLYLTVAGVDAPHRLYRNEGARFVLTGEAALDGAGLRGGMTPLFADWDADGDLDLFVSEWLPRRASLPQDPPRQRWLRNRGDGVFEDATAAVGLGPSPECLAGAAPCDAFSFGASAADLDGDGWLDLAVVADFGTSRLLWGGADGFVDGTREAGVGTEENGMGGTLGDYDGDGDLDWFVSSIFDPADRCARDRCYWGRSGNRLYRNEGGRRFQAVTDEAGVRDAGWGWGAAFFDADNDGDLDLAVAHGYTEGHPLDESFRHGGVRYWQNVGGRFERDDALFGDVVTEGRGLLVFDHEEDGDLDLVAIDAAAGPVLLRNQGTGHHFCRVRLRGPSGNPRGVGAEVRLEAGGRRQVRVIGTTTSFLGQSEAVAHFGLGEVSRVERLEVRWPDGTRTTVERPAADRTLEVRHPRATDADGGEAL